jgi:leucyl aminopeptidase
MTLKLTLIPTDDLPSWLANQSEVIQHWIRQTGFTAKSDTISLIPTPEGKLEQVLAGCKRVEDFWAVGALPKLLPAGNYALTNTLTSMQHQRIGIAWELGAYQFERYKKSDKTIAKLVGFSELQQTAITTYVKSHYLVRDLINTPMEDMGPTELAAAADALCASYSGASIKHIVGDELLTQNYPAIHTVGRASSHEPRLIDLRWGNPAHPKLTLVGKGVCFDSGGLDLKSASNMLIMKKDMGGAAHVLGLAHLIMATELPVSLRVLIPAVENAVSGNAYRPGDVIKTRKGLSVEIGNTDAEGRLILGDALTEACNEQPDLIIDFATLTGAARVAMGTDVPAFFTDNNALANQLMEHADNEQDPLWRLPLYTPYRSLLDSTIADINNAGNSGYGGAITAALFLKEFIAASIDWIHIDLMAWNLGNRPGRPEGGEAMGLRAVYQMLCERYSKNASL